MEYNTIKRMLGKVIKYTLITYFAFNVGPFLIIGPILITHRMGEYKKDVTDNPVYSSIVNKQFETIVETDLFQYTGSDNNWYVNKANTITSQSQIFKKFIKLEKGLKFKVVQVLKKHSKSKGELGDPPYIIAEIDIDQTATRADVKQLFRGYCGYDNFPLEPNPKLLIEIPQDTITSTN